MAKKEQKSKRKSKKERKSIPESNEEQESISEPNEEQESISEPEEEQKSISEPKKEQKSKREPKKKFDFERNSRTIFVGNLPKTLDQKDVAKLFKDCGPVETARIRSIVAAKEKLAPKVALITKRMHPKIDSFNAYVVFKSNDNDESIRNALKMNGKIVDGHHLRVDRAQRPQSKKLTLTSRKKSVFVGNLRFDVRDDDLINHFNRIGAVNYVRIVRDRATGMGKGFAFVVFDERASVKKAIEELNETNFKGRLLRLKKVDKEK